MADAIDRYIQESNKQTGRTKTQVLKSIKTFDIADKHCDVITSADIVEFAQEKLISGVQPQTVSNYLAHLGAVFSIARPAWGFPLNAQAMEDARKVAAKLGITYNELRTSAVRTANIGHFSTRLIATITCVLTTLSANGTTLCENGLQTSHLNHFT